MFLDVDPIIREVVLSISRKDIQLGKKLQTAIMFDLSTTKLTGLLG